MRAMKVRAGKYVMQKAGYKAFVPNKLPPDPAVRIDGDLQRLLSKADRALGRLDGSISTLPNPDLFVFMYVRKEAVLSSQIEGTQSSLQDVLKAEANVFSPERPDDVGEVVSYIGAMNYGLERLDQLPISVRLIKEIHGLLIAETRGSEPGLTPGEVRRSQNWIGPQGCTLNEATYVPPPPDLLPELLGDLEKFIHNDASLPLLIRIGVAHSQFETIHPFLDGNGRVGRLLVTFLLCEREVLSKPVLYLSFFFKKHRQEYYELLQSVRDQGDWESWLRFFLRGIAEVSEEAAGTAKAVLGLREEDRGRITGALGRGAANGHKALEFLFDHPIVSVQDFQALTEMTFAAANNLVSRFEELGILQEITGNARNRRFIYRRYIDLFAER